MKQAEASIVANGKVDVVIRPCSVATYLRMAGWKPTQVVVERNGLVLSRSQLGDIFLEEGDRLEVIQPVAGG